MKRITNIINKLDDERSRKIIFLSHCILNENTRYPGGAFTPGMLSTVVREIDRKGYGIVQMPCPEQRAWGGVLKKYMLLSYGLNNSGSLLNAFRHILFPLFILHTKRVYKRMAHDSVEMIEDYKKSGFDTIGIFGINGSPTCGISNCLDMKKSFDYCAGLHIETIDRKNYNKEMYGNCLKQGKGLFFLEMDKILRKRNISITYYSHDLVQEAMGESIQCYFK
jgi:predicted secreted protein